MIVGAGKDDGFRFAQPILRAAAGERGRVMLRDCREAADYASRLREARFGGRSKVG